MNRRLSTCNKFLSALLSGLMAGTVVMPVRANFRPFQPPSSCPPKPSSEMPDGKRDMSTETYGGHGYAGDPCAIQLMDNGPLATPVNSPNPPPGDTKKIIGKKGVKTGDPIYPSSGNVGLDETDIVIPAPLLPLVFLRSYNSMSSANDEMGHKWHHSYDWFVVQYTNTITIGTRTGRFAMVQALADGFSGAYEGDLHWFQWLPDQNRYDSCGTDGLTLTNSDGLFVMNMPGGYSAHFNSSGALSSFEHAAGQRVVLTYDTNSLATRIQHSNGQYLDLQYSGSLLTAVHTPATNFWIEYQYGGGDLTNTIRHTPRGDFSMSYNYQKRAYLGAPVPAATNTGGYWTTAGSGKRIFVPASQSATGSVNFGTTGIWSGRLPPTAPQTLYSSGWLIRRANARGEVFNYTYDDEGGATAKGVAVWMETPSSGIASFVASTNKGLGLFRTHLTYLSTNTTLVDTFARGIWHRESLSFDPHWGDLITTIHPSGISGQFTRNSARDVTKARLTEGTNYLECNGAYDTSHNVLSERAGLNSSGSNDWNYTWSRFQTLESMTDPLGLHFVIAQSNALPVNVSEHSVGGQSLDIALDYSTNGLLLSVTNAAGRSVQAQYDERGYATTITPAAGPSLALGHDVLGHVNQVTQPGSTGSRMYQIDSDERGRALHIAYPNGLEERNTYDPYGNLVQHVDTAGRTSSYTYVAGHLTSATRVLEGEDRFNVTIGMKYDEQLNTVHVTDPMGRQVEAYQLDDNDRVVAVTNIENQTMTIQWKSGSLADSVRRFDASTVQFDYNTDGRMTALRQPGTTNSFAWLGNGLLASAARDGQAIQLTYNDLNRLTSVTQPVPRSALYYQWTPDGLVSNITAPAGNYSYDYDSAGRLTTFATPAGTFTLTYDPNNGLPATLSGTGANESFTYDIIDRLTNIEWGALGGLDYSYDNASMITQIVDRLNVRTNAYAYDSLYRLIGERTYSVTSAPSVVEYQYDLAGNRTQKVENGTAIIYNCDEANRLLSWSDGLQTGQAFYDAAGNTTTLIYNASRRLDLEWNSRYELVAAYTNGALAEKYEYDAFGRRTLISDGTTTNYLIYDGPHVIAETDAIGTLQRSYTYGPGIDNILSMSIHSGQQSGHYRYLKNQQNTVLAILNSSGIIVERYQYDAWGNAEIFDAAGKTLAMSLLGNRYLFQGRERSASSKLLYFRARLYDPLVGRWLSQDPTRIRGGLNLYRAFALNPNRYMDPFGHDIYVDTGDGGHAALFIDDPTDSTYIYTYSFGPQQGGWGDMRWNEVYGPSKTVFARTPKPTDFDDQPGLLRIQTDEEQDRRALQLARHAKKEDMPYCGAFNNCTHMARMILDGSGVPVGNHLTDWPSRLQHDVNNLHDTTPQSGINDPYWPPLNN